MYNIALADFPAQHVPSVSPEESLAGVISLFSHSRANHAVVEGNGGPQGVLSGQDLLQAFSQGLHPTSPVRNIMRTRIVCAPSHTRWHAAQELMRRHAAEHLLVTGDKGIITALFDKHTLFSPQQSSRLSAKQVILDSTQTLFWLLDINGVVQDANNAALKLINATASEVIGTPFIATSWWTHDLIQQKKIQLALAQCLAGKTVTLETAHHGSSGEPILLTVSLRQIHSQQGSPLLLVEGSDITRYKMAESTLRRDSAILRSVLDTIPDLVFYKDTNSHYLGCNKAFEVYFGQRQKQIIGRNDFDFVDPDTATHYQKMDKLALNANMPCRNEEWIRYPDGHQALLETLKTPIRDEHGEVFGLLGIARDITERKALENQLSILSEALKQISEAIALTDEKCRFNYVNPAFCRLFGYHAEEIIGKNSNVLLDKKNSRGLTSSQISRIVAERGHYRGEVWRKSKSGTDIPLLISTVQITDKSSNRAWHVSSYIDLTDIKRIHEKLHKMAHFDVLTKLPNRAQLTHRLSLELAHAKRNKKQVALLFIDLDHFKVVNDTLGHHTGDLLLQEVAARLKRCVRESDTVARLGGDEFTVLMADISTSADAEIVASKIIAAIDIPFCLAGHEIKTSTSIGIALYPTHTTDEDRLLMLADSAMYIAKTKGRNAFSLYGQ